MVVKTVEALCFAIFCLKIFSADDPCKQYTELDDWRRSVSYDETYTICDTFLIPGWYRVISKAGEEMPTECVHGGFRCGTMHSIWMNGTFPVAGEINNVTACASDYNTDCCTSSYDIQVKNCSGYYVYNLVPAKYCPQAYCFGHELPCPSGETSLTGFTPGCKYDPCLKINHNELDDWRRSVKNNNTSDALCDSLLAPGWYRPISKAGQFMPSVCPVNGFTCGTTHPIWMNGTFPESGETQNVTACSVGNTNECCLNEYDIQVKNCSDFILYNLKSTLSCPEAYCFGNELPCVEGETSDNGFTPGCKIDPCHTVNHKVIKGQENRTSNYTLQPNQDPIDDSQLPESFYRFESQTGNDIVDAVQSMFQCGTKFPLYMIGNVRFPVQQTRQFRDEFVCQDITVLVKTNHKLKYETVEISGCIIWKSSPMKDSGYCVDENLPWIVTVTVLGLVCTTLTGVILGKKLLAKTRVHEEPPPPPYSSVVVQKPPILHDINASIPRK